MKGTRVFSTHWPLKASLIVRPPKRSRRRAAPFWNVSTSSCDAGQRGMSRGPVGGASRMASSAPSQQSDDTVSNSAARNEAPVRRAPEELLATGARRGAGLVASVNTVAGVVVDARARHGRAVGAAVAVYVVLLAPERHASYIGVAVRGARLRDVAAMACTW